MIEKIFDGYSIKARYFPALICLIPFIVAKIYILDPWLQNHTSFNQVVVYLGSATVSCVLIYLLAEINRTTAKVFFENKEGFPTVKFLLSDSKESTELYRNTISVKTEKDFGLRIPSLLEQKNNLDESKMRIGEIVQLIISKVRNGHLVLKHNVEYGFFRNLTGGALVALTVSLILALISRSYLFNTELLSISLNMTLMYFILMVIAWGLKNYYGKEYTRILFREYLSS